VGRRKGGNSVLSAPRPEVADDVAQGVVAVAGSQGDLLEGTALDEIGAERFITAMERVGRFEEEAQAA
jgi:hypothetical protein